MHKIFSGLPVLALAGFLSCAGEIGPQQSYQPVEHTVTFNSWKGTSVSSQIVIQGDYAVRPADPVRYHYDFAGWFSDPGFTTPWIFETHKVTGALILYAKWIYSDEIPETFDPADRPVYAKDSVQDFWLMKPWNYDKEYNSDRSYAIVISLHGSGSPSPYAPCIVNSDYEKQTFPCFFMGAHTTQSTWGADAAKVISQIEQLKINYRIDSNRIYLIGFSMGGVGTYEIANAYYAFNGQVVAGAVRLSGQFVPELVAGPADRTSVWYHIGLTDSAVRVDIARSAYAFIKNYPAHAAAYESSVIDSVAYAGNTYMRTTQILTKDSIEIMKLSEYAGLGHDALVPFKDSELLEWLFSQSLERR